MDKPVAGLLKDLKQRGMLEDTLVIWGGEFGRLPISQSKNGRDHNRQGFTIWMAGGGVKAGHVHGASDEFAYAAVKDRVSVQDFHATVLHLLGLDNRKLIYPRISQMASTFLCSARRVRPVEYGEFSC